MKILSTHDLQAIMQRAENALRLREQSNKKIAEKSCGLTIGTDHLQILVCGGTGCTASSGHLIAEHLQKALEQYNIVHQVEVITTGCFGFCEKGPIVKIIPDNTFYIRVTPEDVDEIITKHIINGHRVERLLYIDPKTERVVSDSKHMDFYRKQQRIALRNCGFINPENIEEYIARHGYLALADSLLHKHPIDVIGVIKRSGLRGRGGGGFPTGLKWESAHKQAADTKYVVCNADEGDPGAFMDRSIMEGDPHSIVEAMTICGYAIGSRQGLVYIRAEYPLAIQRLKTAIAQAREYGLLGERILGTDFCFDIEIRYGAGAFVCGEGSALTTSIEGNRGMPRVKPPRTVEHGLFDKPTVLNNVETFCNVPPILLNGAKWYQGYGPANNHGTKAFALTGNVQNTGLIEVPMGTTLREVIFDIGGGVKGGAFKAVQIGGPSGGCLCISATEDHLDMKLDFDSLKKVGAMIGSGGLVVMNDKSCMVEVARFFMNFTQNESCGKCVPCREGTKRMLELLTDITEGRGTMEHIELLETLAETVSATALCGLGKTAASPVVSTLKYFRDEYIAHVVDKKCPAGQCKALTSLQIDPELCKGCTKCARMCPVGAISGNVKEPHVIDTTKCIKCGACKDGCNFGAVKEV